VRAAGGRGGVGHSAAAVRALSVGPRTRAEHVISQLVADC